MFSHACTLRLDQASLPASKSHRLARPLASPAFCTASTPAVSRSLASSIAGLPRAGWRCVLSVTGPNPSLKLRPNGVPPGRRSAVRYPALRRPGVTPSAPA